ncbi:phage tail assembly chaperone [Exiguobacterium sp. CinTr1]|uniref:phage tail assembly chaperone n=1 Tax=Exiguobacterium sp. CinTr1 TaxID=2995315 RepID=UPI0022E48E1F|nr:hypothetical protein [Exiguobacterium sp. CinTr1]
MAKKTKLELLLGMKPVGNRDIYPSQRFKDAGAAITIRPITDEEFKAAQNLATDASGEMDETVASLALIEKALVEPTVDELREATGALTNDAALRNQFLLGERAKISSEILSLSGLDMSFNAAVDEAKK